MVRIVTRWADDLVKIKTKICSFFKNVMVFNRNFIKSNRDVLIRMAQSRTLNFMKSNIHLPNFNILKICGVKNMFLRSSYVGFL